MTCATSSSACSTVWRGSSTNPVWIVSQRRWNSAFSLAREQLGRLVAGASTSAAAAVPRLGVRARARLASARSRARVGDAASSTASVSSRPVSSVRPARRRRGRRVASRSRPRLVAGQLTGARRASPLPDLLSRRVRVPAVRAARRTARGSGRSPGAGPRCSRVVAVDGVRLAVVLDDLGVVDGDVGRLLLEVLDGVAALVHDLGEERRRRRPARTPAGRRTAPASRASARRSARARPRPAGGCRTAAPLAALAQLGLGGALIATLVDGTVVLGAEALTQLRGRRCRSQHADDREQHDDDDDQ